MNFKKLLLCVSLFLGSCSNSTTSPTSLGQSCANIAQSILEGKTPSCAIQVELMDLDSASFSDDDPSLIFAQDGFYYLVFLSDRTANKDLWIVRSEEGKQWSQPVQITTHLDEDLYPTLYQSQDKKFHLFWHRFSNQTGQSHLFYRQTLDPLNWGSNETQVTTGQVDDHAPIFIDVGGGEFRAYFSSAARALGTGKPQYNHDLYYIRSTNAGQSWASPVLLPISSITESDRFPFVVRKNTNEYYLFYQRHATDSPTDPTSDLMMSVSMDGLVWGASAPITSQAGDNIPDVFPNIYKAPLLGEWVLSWTSTELVVAGGLVNLKLSDINFYPARGINLSSILGITGWSTRVSTHQNGKSLIVFVSNQSGKPRLYSIVTYL